ncbi:MAG: SixA phosphatase family protein [Alphaproteobacteria bacterium]
MKRLYILRHAQALSTPVGGSDFDRPLAPQGLEDAKALGRKMAKHDYKPDICLYSPALRTTQTLENLELSCKSVSAVEDMYDANAQRLLDLINNSEDDYASLLLVGHNPAIHELAMRLAGEESAASPMQRMMQGYKPGSLSVFDCPCAVWNDVEYGGNILSDFLEPLDYNAPERPTRWM